MPLLTHHTSSLRLLALAALSAAALIAHAQWTDHFSYAQPRHICVANGRTLVANKAAVFFRNPDDGRLLKVSKVNALSSTDISAFASDGNNCLIGYADGQIDIFDPVKQTTISLPDLYNAGSKYPIKDIYAFASDNEAWYVGFSGGVLQVDRRKAEVRSLWPIVKGGMPVNALSVLEGRLVAATDEGLYVARLGAQPLEGFDQWQRLPITDEATGHDLPATLIAAQGGELLVATPQKIFNTDTVPAGLCRVVLPDDYPGGKLEPTIEAIGEAAGLRAIKPAPKALANIGFVLVYPNRVVLLDTYNQNSRRLLDNYGDLYDAVAFTDGSLAVANAAGGLLTIEANGARTEVLPNGPPANEGQTDVKADGGDVYLPITGIGMRAGCFDGHRWINSSLPTQWYANLLAVNPLRHGDVFISSRWSSLFHFVDKQLCDQADDCWFRAANTGGAICTKNTNAITFDNEGNLIVLLGRADDKCLVVRDAQGNWANFGYGSLNRQVDPIQQVVCTANNNLWLMSSNTLYMMIFNLNGTPTDPGDDRYVTTGNTVYNEPQYVGSFDWMDSETGERVGTKPQSAAEDANGDVWLVTSGGVLVCRNNRTLLDDGGPIFNRIIIPRNDGSGLADYLLDGLNVTCIVVDGANRKWLGTQSNGVYLVSPDGMQMLQHFTTANSPMPSNNVVALTLTDAGELFISTISGLVSYQTDASTSADKLDNDNLKIYPNPVEPNMGIDFVDIEGLLDGAHVMVADISGHAVYRGEAIGGKARWDLRRFGGRRVAPGVYMVLATGPEGGKTRAMGKILVK